MPKYFCEYCGIYLTHSNPRGRYQHSHGRKHIKNKLEYYSQFLSENPENTNDQVLAITSKIYKGLQQVSQIAPNIPNVPPQMLIPPEIQQMQQIQQIQNQMPDQFQIPIPQMFPPQNAYNI